jgi:hypothetical protein
MLPCRSNLPACRLLPGEHQTMQPVHLLLPVLPNLLLRRRRLPAGRQLRRRRPLLPERGSPVRSLRLLQPYEFGLLLGHRHQQPPRLRLHGERWLLPQGPEALWQHQVVRPQDPTVLHRYGHRLALQPIGGVLSRRVLQRRSHRAVLRARAFATRARHAAPANAAAWLYCLLRRRRHLPAVPGSYADRHCHHYHDGYVSLAPRLSPTTQPRRKGLLSVAAAL